MKILVKKKVSPVHVIFHDASHFNEHQVPNLVNTKSLRLIVRNLSIVSDSALLVAMLFSVVLTCSSFPLFSQCQIIKKNESTFNFQAHRA